MAIRFDCACGQRISAPVDMMGKRAKCPKCGVVLNIPSAEEALQSAALQVVDAEPNALEGRVCTICQTGVARDEVALLCPACQSPFHRECWDEIGGCATYGCKLMPQAPKDEQGQAEESQGWGETKRCPRCEREIRSSAVKCRFCRARFPSALPMTREEYATWRTGQAKLGPTRAMAIGLFVVSLFGILAPLVVVVGGIWIAKSHGTLRKVGGIPRVLAYVSVGLSVIYCLLMVFVSL